MGAVIRKSGSYVYVFVTIDYRFISLFLQLLWLDLWRHRLKLMKLISKLLSMLASVSQRLTHYFSLK